MLIIHESGKRTRINKVRNIIIIDDGEQCLPPYTLKDALKLMEFLDACIKKLKEE